MRAVLEIHVANECPNCAQAVHLAQQAKKHVPGIEVRLRKATSPGPGNHPGVFAVPTYVFNDRTLWLGNPPEDLFLDRLRLLHGQLEHDSVSSEAGEMKDAKLQALSSIEIFKDLSEQEVVEMDQAITMTTCEPGRVFYAPEDTGEVLFMLKQGRVQLYRLSPEGKKLTMAVLEAGAIFGEMSIVGQGMHDAFAEAIDACTLCVMSRADVERLVLEKPRVALRFLEALAFRLRETETRLEELAFKSIPARLASLLLKLSRVSPKGDLVEGYTHQDLADMLGTYRETTTQTLNDFKARGWLRIGRKRIEILERSKLELQASG